MHIFFYIWTCPNVVHRGCCDRLMEYSTQVQVTIICNNKALPQLNALRGSAESSLDVKFILDVILHGGV